MKVPEETICSICKRFFCCSKCRHKHEIRKHGILVAGRKSISLQESNSLSVSKTPKSYVLCPICASKPFPLSEVIPTELLEHITQMHIPLHCQKCLKIYSTIEELREFSKCTQMPQCELSMIVEPSIAEFPKTTFHKTEIKSNSISTQTSPIVEVAVRTEIGGVHLTPIPVFSLHCKTSSLRNISVINNSSSGRRSSITTSTQTDCKGKLVRTTSTPVHTETEYGKQPKERTFNVSEGQVSSIYNSGNETENQNSCVAPCNAGGSITSVQHNIETIKKPRKFGGRPKMAAVTPLRRVMSKSIQRAFAEHGFRSLSDQKLVESTDLGSGFKDPQSSSPLDLRLSPALRRCGGDVNSSFKHMEKPISDNKALSPPKSSISIKTKVVSKQQLTTEAIVITQEVESQLNFTTNSMDSLVSGHSTYKSCESVEIISSTEILNNENLDPLRPLKSTTKHGEHPSSLVGMTPILYPSSTTYNKKLIQFETPNIKKDRTYCKTPTSEIFYTPSGSPAMLERSNSLDSALKVSTVVRNLSGRFSKPFMQNCVHSTMYNFNCAEGDQDYNDDVFLTSTAAGTTTPTEISKTDKQTEEVTGNGLLQSLMINSIKYLPRWKRNDTKPDSSIIKRCASIAGSLIRTKSLLGEGQLPSLKRKRINTIDSPSDSSRTLQRLSSLPNWDSTCVNKEFSSSKRFRIQGRKPIERMRKGS